MTETRITVARWSFDRLLPVWSNTASFTTWRDSWSNYPARLTPQTDSKGYEYVLEDLEDLAVEASAADWPGPGLPPSIEAVRSAHAVIRETAEVFPAPEVTARETGTVLLLWHAPGGFLSIEVGDSKFGLVGARDGLPSLRVNGEIAEIRDFLPHRPASPATSVRESSASFARRAITHMLAASNAITRGSAGVGQPTTSH